MPLPSGMLQSSVCRVASIACLVLGSGACATTMKPPVVNSGPVSSGNGVQVAAVRQACQQTEPVDEVPTGTVDETVEIQVRNGSPEPLTVYPERFRLIGAAGGAPATANAPSGDARTVATGDTQMFQLEFNARNGLECTKEMQLDPSAAITLRDTPLSIQPVPFRPL